MSFRLLNVRGTASKEGVVNGSRYVYVVFSVLGESSLQVGEWVVDMIDI